jgi:hypothetical protein
MKLDELDPNLTIRDLVHRALKMNLGLYLVLTPKDPGAAVRILALLHAAKRWHEEP